MKTAKTEDVDKCQFHSGVLFQCSQGKSPISRTTIPGKLVSKVPAMVSNGRRAVGDAGLP
jgi:hypothetical protein